MEQMSYDTGTKTTALVITATASFLTPFAVSSLNIALPLLAREFGMNAVSLSWMGTAFLLSAAVFLLPFGRMADIYGKKKIFTAGIAVFTLASALAPFGTSSSWIIFFRALQGLGGAMIFGTGMAILIEIFPPRERGRVIGINVAATYSGLSLGPVLGGVLAQSLGWRSIFWAASLAGAAALALIALKLKGEWAAAKGEKFDIAGSVIYGLAVASGIYGFSLIPKSAGWALSGAGLAALAVFVFWELKIPSPVLDMRLFRNNPAFAFSNLAALINYSATFAVTFLLSLYLQYVKGCSPQKAGLILVSQPAVMAVCSPLAGKLSDSIEPRVLSSLGMAVTAAGLLGMVAVNPQTPYYMITGLLLLQGAGFGLFSSPNTNSVMGSVEKKYYGVASATLSSMRLMGQMLSMGITMLVFALYLGQGKIGPGNIGFFLAGFRSAFVIFSALCFFGIFASLARGNIRQECSTDVDSLN